MKKIVRRGVLLKLSLPAVMALLQACASATGSYHFAQKRIEQGDLQFHKKLVVSEYINAFPQDGIRVPKGQDWVLSVEPFSRTQFIDVKRALVQVAIKTRSPSEAELKSPVSLCFVLDVSGSMRSGNKLSSMVDAVLNAVAELNDGDEVAVVTFSTKASILVPPQQIDADSREAIIQAVWSISSDGSTNIQEGLIYGYREAARFTNTGPRRVILVTDGQSNVEDAAPEALARQANVRYLEGIRISAVGLGYDVDDARLRDIAKKGKGHYYFAENGSALTSLLREELRTTVVPVVDVKALSIATAPGVRLIKFHGPDSTSLGDSGGSVPVGELNVGDWRVFVAELEGRWRTGKNAPITVKAQFNNLVNGETGVREGRANIVFKKPGTRKTALNQAVVENSVLFGNAETLRRVGVLDERGDKAGYGEALGIVDVQINNNRIAYEMSHKESFAREMEKLGKVRRIIAAKAAALDEQAGKPESSPAPLVKTANTADQQGGGITGLVRIGVELASKSIDGLWATVAQLLLLAL